MLLRDVVGTRPEPSRFAARRILLGFVGLQYIYKDLDFNKPFFLTYVSNSLFMLLGPGQWGLERAQANGRCIRGHEPPLPSTSSSIKQVICL